MDIEVTCVDTERNIWHAYSPSNRSLKSQGKSKAEAVGNFVMDYPTTCKIKVEEV